MNCMTCPSQRFNRLVTVIEFDQHIVSVERGQSYDRYTGSGQRVGNLRENSSDVKFEGPDYLEWNKAVFSF